MCADGHNASPRLPYFTSFFFVHAWDRPFPFSPFLVSGTIVFLCLVFGYIFFVFFIPHCGCSAIAKRNRPSEMDKSSVTNELIQIYAKHCPPKTQQINCSLASVALWHRHFNMFIYILLIVAWRSHKNGFIWDMFRLDIFQFHATRSHTYINIFLQANFYFIKFRVAVFGGRTIRPSRDGTASWFSLWFDMHGAWAWWSSAKIALVQTTVS